MSSYIPNVRALVNQAPTALDYETLANNLEYLNGQRFPQYALMSLTADKNVTISGVTGSGALTFDSFASNNYGLGSAGPVLSIPSDAKFARMICQIQVSFGNHNIRWMPKLSNYIPVLNTGPLYCPRIFNIGYGSTADGFESGIVDTGWVPWNSGSVSGFEVVTLGGAPSPFTILRFYSWLYLEVIK